MQALRLTLSCVLVRRCLSSAAAKPAPSFSSPKSFIQSCGYQRFLASAPEKPVSSKGGSRKSKPEESLDPGPDVLSSCIRGFEDVEELKEATDDVKKMFNLKYANQREINKTMMEEMAKRVQFHAGDKSSLEVRIARWTYAIRNLTQHCRAHPKDKSAMRHIMLFIGERRRAMLRLRQANYERYCWVLHEIGIRPVIVRKNYDGFVRGGTKGQRVLLTRRAAFFKRKNRKTKFH